MQHAGGTNQLVSVTSYQWSAVAVGLGKTTVELQAMKVSRLCFQEQE